MPSKNVAIQTALSGDWRSATSINKQLVNENPNDIEALNRLAFGFTVLGKIKDARSAYKKVLEIDPLNPIAMRNLKKLTDSKSNGEVQENILQNKQLKNTFLEESGKTKVVELINVAQSSIISNLQIGQPLFISIKRSKIFVLNDNKKYIGVLPDDIGKNLIRFIKGGNEYDTLVRSTDNHQVKVFLKEIKRSTRFKNQPSFYNSSEKSSIFHGRKIKEDKPHFSSSAKTRSSSKRKSR